MTSLQPCDCIDFAHALQWAGFLSAILLYCNMDDLPDEQGSDDSFEEPRGSTDGAEPRFFKPLLDSSVWQHFVANLYRHAAINMLDCDLRRQQIAGPARAGLLRRCKRQIIARCPSYVRREVLPFLRHFNKQDLVNLQRAHESYTGNAFWFNDRYQDHRWCTLDSDTQQRTVANSRRLLWRQLQAISCQMPPFLRDATVQLLESLPVTEQLQHMYRLLDCRRRILLVCSTVEAPDVASESEAEAATILSR